MLRTSLTVIGSALLGAVAMAYILPTSSVEQTDVPAQAKYEVGFQFEGPCDTHGSHTYKVTGTELVYHVVNIEDLIPLPMLAREADIDFAVNFEVIKGK